ncbi:MAG TPA: hypothetical protein VFN19_09130 [Candidatus Nanopelagicales bacterium]|nr:hypothetical protein [Candidatus Nanopelagicales bacterium]
MPTHTRCPQCSASLPQNAAWCSLCHADLRRRAEPELVPVAAAAEPAAPSPGPVRGRHRRSDPATGAPAQVPATGRHRDAPAAALPEVGELVADAPVGADGRPDLEVLTSQLMARLAATERSGGLPDLDAVPGGKWGVLFGGMIGLTVVLVLIGAVVGWVFMR